MFADGSNGSVTLENDAITIRRKGFANILTQGIQGDKSVPLKSITAIQFRPAGMLMAGMIQFTILGGREFRGGMLEATKDENAVLFDRKQQPDFEKLKVEVENRQSGRKAGSPSKVTDVASELERLAALVERGFVTRAEFNARKAALLTTL